LNIFIHSGDIRRQTSKSTEIGPNFACFLPLKIFWGGSPKILDRDYKTERSNEHRAKFGADRPTELGDYAAKKRKKTQRNISPSENYRFRGGTNKPQQNLSPLPQAIAYGRTNYKFGAKPNVSPPGALSPIGGN